MGILCNSFYSVLYKKLRQHETSLWDTITLVMLIGLLTLPISALALPILHFTAVELFELPPQHLLVRIAIQTLCKPLMILTMLFTIRSTSPLFFQVGFSLVIPTGIVIESYIYNLKVNFWFWVGLIAIVIGWSLTMWPQSNAA